MHRASRTRTKAADTTRTSKNLSHFRCRGRSCRVIGFTAGRHRSRTCRSTVVVVVGLHGRRTRIGEDLGVSVFTVVHDGNGIGNGDLDIGKGFGFTTGATAHGSEITHGDGSASGKPGSVGNGLPAGNSGSSGTNNGERENGRNTTRSRRKREREPAGIGDTSGTGFPTVTGNGRHRSNSSKRPRAARA